MHAVYMYTKYKGTKANEDIATSEAKCRKCTNVCMVGVGGGGGWYVCAPQAVNKVEERHFHKNGYRKEHRGGGGVGGGPDKQPNPTAQQYMLGETCLTKVRNRMCQELCNVTV